MSDLGTLLALLHDAPDRVRRLRAEIVTRTDHEVAMEAFRRHAEESGAQMMVAFGEGDEDDEDGDAGESEFRTRLWLDRDHDLVREERGGAHESLSVKRGEIWWHWDPHNGAMSNEQDDASSTVGGDAAWILGGLGLVGLLRVAGAPGRGSVAGRDTWRFRAAPR